MKWQTKPTAANQNTPVPDDDPLPMPDNQPRCPLEVLHNLSRRLPHAPPGVMELINMTAITRFQAEGIHYLHFGFTPCVGLGAETDNAPGRSPILSWLLRQIGTYGRANYPAQSQAMYKMKWGPQIIAPQYVAYQGRFRLNTVWSLLRLTQAI